MLKMGYITHLNAICFLIMKHFAYLCKLIEYVWHKIFFDLS